MTGVQTCALPIYELVDADPSLRVSAHLEPIEDPKSYDDVDDV